MKSILGISFLSVMLIAASISPVFASGSEDGSESSHSRLHVTVPLEPLSLKSKDYMLLVDTTPDAMTGGHVAVKAPCNDEGISPIQVLQGVAEEKMEKVELDMGNMLHALSTHGESCLYHIPLPENPNWVVMDVVIFNSSNEDVKFNSGDSITVFVNSFEKMEGGHHAESSDDESGSHDKHSESSESEDDSRHAEESSHDKHSQSEDSTNMGHSGASAAIDKIFQMNSKLYVLNVRVSASDDLSGASVHVESDVGTSKITIPTLDQGSSILLRGTITANNPESITALVQ